MLLRFFSSNYTMLEKVITLCSVVFVVFCCLPIHEYAHAWMATRLGDDTARLKGRLTINPMKHISLLGALMILLVGFGYAKPVPVNINNFNYKTRKRDFALVALAGPVSNLIMALFYLFLYQFVLFLMNRTAGGSSVMNAIAYFFYFAGEINISLAVFNLIPIPPLDGSRLLGVIVPDRFYYLLLQYERYIMIGLLLLLWFGVLTVPLNFLSGLVEKLFLWLTGLPFRIFS